MDALESSSPTNDDAAWELISDRAKLARENIGPPPKHRKRYSIRALRWCNLVEVGSGRDRLIVRVSELDEYRLRHNERKRREARRRKQ